MFNNRLHLLFWFSVKFYILAEKKICLREHYGIKKNKWSNGILKYNVQNVFIILFLFFPSIFEHNIVSYSEIIFNLISKVPISNSENKNLLNEWKY